MENQKPKTDFMLLTVAIFTTAFAIIMFIFYLTFQDKYLNEIAKCNEELRQAKEDALVFKSNYKWIKRKARWCQKKLGRLNDETFTEGDNEVY